ncbi:phytoene desaturase family protein [Streptomyces sp. NPDC051561]|uniref:phytoene desaturase family protein n=1 Tax=Streptomyces sp. NPDC051561 TaxID=3365658 RepID=UPI0037B9EC0C
MRALPVEQVTVRRGRAGGVLLTSGERLDAPVVVSNADYHRTMTDLLPPGLLSPALRGRVERGRYALPTASLFLAVDHEPDWPTDANIWCFADDDIDVCHSRSPGTGFGVVTLASAIAPPGQRAFQVLTLLPRTKTEPYSRTYRRSPEYTERKAHVTARLLDLAERALGPFRDRLTHLELSTAETHTRYTGATGGTAYGLAATPRQTGPLRPSYRTPVDGLYLVGVSTRAGGGFPGAGASGVLCASEILGRPLLAAVRAGAVLGDPGLLPERGEGWDPLRVSRGRARAARSVPPLRTK